MCVDVLPTHAYIYPMHAWCLWGSEEGIKSPGTGGRMFVSNPVLGKKPESSTTRVKSILN